MDGKLKPPHGLLRKGSHYFEVKGEHKQVQNIFIQSVYSDKHSVIIPYSHASLNKACMHKQSVPSPLILILSFSSKKAWVQIKANQTSRKTADKLVCKQIL